MYISTVMSVAQQNYVTPCGQKWHYPKMVFITSVDHDGFNKIKWLQSEIFPLLVMLYNNGSFYTLIKKSFLNVSKLFQN